MILMYKAYMRVRDSCERLAVCGRGCEVRAAMPVHVLAVALLAFAFVLFCPHYAFADSSVVWGPSSIPNYDQGVVVAAPDRFRAAATLLGYDDAAVSEWSSDVKAKLSNASTGGSFYTLTQAFTELGDAVNDSGVVGSITSSLGNAFWSVAETLYGSDLWIAGFSSSLRASAASDLSRILSGENIGGDTGGGFIDGDYMVFDFKAISPSPFSAVNKLYLPISSISMGGNNTIDDIKSGAIVLRLTDSTPYGYIFQYSFGIDDTPDVSTDYGLWTKFGYDTGKCGATVGATYYSHEIVGDKLYLTPSSTLNVYLNRDAPFTFISASNGMNNMGVLSGTSGGGDEPVVPPSNWPDEPSAPSPPELPNPTDPTVDPPEPYDPYDPVVNPPTPYNPTGGDTYIYNTTNITEPIDTSSILEWIKKIFYELKALHTDLSVWVQNLGSALDKLRVTLNNGFTQLYGAVDDVESDIEDVRDSIDNACSQLYARMGEIGDDIADEFSSLKQYLKQLFNWLGEKMNFNNEGYDDTSVIYWLKRIWSKLGSGDINLRPTDPTSDPENWWDWLVRAIQNFLIGLAATSTELISEIADLASQVMHEFPFSIPWDIAAVLAALSTAPITPVFTYTVPAIDGWWSAFDVVIDMHPFDGAAETIRLMEKLLFTGLLIWKSKELLDFMDVTKWFGG